jgi:hypothetical protein
MERVSDGELMVEGLDRLAPDDRQKLEAGWNDIRNLLLPNDTSTASIDLLTKLNIEPVYIDNEPRAAAEVQRICAIASAIGLDIETAPLPQYLPKAWPIAVTKDGRRSKLQTKMDTSPGLDPFRAEVRLLQIAAEIDGTIVVLVIDLRRVPVGSPALAPLWRCKISGTTSASTRRCWRPMACLSSMETSLTLFSWPASCCAESRMHVGKDRGGPRSPLR